MLRVLCVKVMHFMPSDANNYIYAMLKQQHVDKLLQCEGASYCLSICCDLKQHDSMQAWV